MVVVLPYFHDGPRFDSYVESHLISERGKLNKTSVMSRPGLWSVCSPIGSPMLSKLNLVASKRI